MSNVNSEQNRNQKQQRIGKLLFKKKQSLRHFMAGCQKLIECY